MKKKQVYALILAAILLLTAGCSKKAEKIPQNMQKTTEGTAVDSGDVTAIFQGAEAWKEEFTIKSGEKEKTVKIEAPVYLTDRKSLPVIDGHALKFDEPLKEKTVRFLFGDEDLYLADDAHATRNELKDVISILESTVEYYSRTKGLEDEYQIEKERLENCRKYIKTAKDSYTVTTDDCKGNHYAAKRDGVWYRLDFSNAGEDNYFWNGYQSQIWFRAKDMKDVAPASLSDCDYINFDVGTSNLRAENIENPCKYSLEESRKIVQDFLKEMGLYDMDITNEYAFQWYGGYDADDNGFSQGDKEEVNGYKFIIAPVQNHESLYDNNKTESNPGGVIIVSDAGIVSALLRSPFVIEKLSENPKLLSLSQIKEGIRQELKAHPDGYFSPDEKDNQGSVKFVSLKLDYLPVKSEKEPDKISFLPVWTLGNYRMQYYDIRINAIDGSVIMDENI